MLLNRIKFSYLFVIFIVTLIEPAFTQTLDLYANSELVNYIFEVSKAITQQLPISEDLGSGELKISLLLSPNGTLKDAYILETSGSEDLDQGCLQAVWRIKRFPALPAEWAQEDLWLDIPIIFEVEEETELPISAYTVKLDADSQDKAPKGSFYVELDEAMEMALENHMPARIALEEMNLAKLKVREARRALYPATSLNYMETEGDATGGIVSFENKEYKLKFEQPLYYGWRLKYAVDQAMVNLEASRNSYEKVLQDLRLEVDLAFYNYIATKMSLRLQEELYREADAIVNMAKKRFEKGYSTKAEYLEVQSQYSQIGYQLASSKNEVEIAKMNLLQAMNIDSDEDIKAPQELKLNKVDLKLEECLEFAFKKRPDLKVKELMANFSDYERKIVKSKDQLKVDLTGSYGRSGGAFATETLQLREDWYFGLKVTKPFSGNTMSTSYTKDKTAPKYGQTTRTSSTTRSVELGLLDNLAHFSEEKTAEINYEKAVDEVENLRQTIVKEVKESYFNYKKALVQVESNLNKVKFKEEELKIIKARVELNEAPISELLRGRMGLTDERNFYIEALGSLNQSFARLDKATGYSIEK